MIRRRGQVEHEESSSDEEDAFSALARKGSKRQKKGSGTDNQPINTATTSSSSGQSSTNNNAKKTEGKAGTMKKLLPVSLTSSMKRHHKPNEMRKAKMDALLQELEAEKHREHRFVPEKKGSFVEPSEEHLTTNIFVGNLAPSITEEDMTDLFLQFGELYSVKIMWPRTPAEKSRKRNTGFVCFMNRSDAEQAMEACNEKDPFNVGRQLMMRWGKNVKKNVKFGSGRMMLPAAVQKTGPRHNDFSDVNNIPIDDIDGASIRSHGLPDIIQIGGGKESWDIARAEPYQESIHSSEAIKVNLPEDPNRFHFISTVASYVARDGSSMERCLIQSEAGNPLFNFLNLSNAGQHQREEYIFYRWRVYSFCQGDEYSKWRTDPFVMFHPQGRFWIPPPLNKDIAEGNDPTRKRRPICQTNPQKQSFMTGRQFELALRKGNRRGDGRDSLTKAEFEQFDLIVMKKLTISRESIQKAMAFCFEKSIAAKEIASMLKEALLDESPSTSIDMRIARLYLISDILFNSQQPGVKNAFMYRDALERMAPDIFSALGKHGRNSAGRMTMNKLRKAVSSVLGAWTEWSVYNPNFLDELEARFEGREIVETPAVEPEDKKEPEEDEKNDIEETVIINQPRGGWTEVADEEVDEEERDSVHPEGEEPLPDARNVSDVVITIKANDGIADKEKVIEKSRDHVSCVEPAEAVGGELERDGGKNDDNLDGEELVDEELLGGNPVDVDDADGVPIEDDDGQNLDGEELVEEELLNGKPDDLAKADMGGDPNDAVEIDGDPMSDKDEGDKGLDGEAIEDIDSDPVAGDPDADDLAKADMGGDIGGVPNDAVEIDGDPMSDEDEGDKGLDGEAIDEDIDGDPVADEDEGDKGLDGEAIDEDIDGDPVADEDEGDKGGLDGEAIDEDIDGDPVADDDLEAHMGVDPNDAVEIDGDPMSDEDEGDKGLDGEAIDEDIDGDPVADDDVDGMPIDD